jgi:CheY-like chemotaxis protein
VSSRAPRRLVAAEDGTSNVVELAQGNSAVETAPDVDASPPALINEVGDDRDNIQAGDAVLLIVENDREFARFLLETAREKGYKGLVTSLGSGALIMVEKYQPSAITLDIFLPAIAGWRILERLKHQMSSRHIPVCVISTEEEADRALYSGALRFVTKPVQSKEVLENLLDGLKSFYSNPPNDVLLIGADVREFRQLQEQLGSIEGVRVMRAETGEAALALLHEQRFDCVVLHTAAALASADTLVKTIHETHAGRAPAIIVCDDASHWNDEFERVIRNDPRTHRVRSFERLLDQTLLCLHRKVAALPVVQQQMLEKIYQSNKVLTGKRVLIVDDDIRNIFALSSVLEDKAMKIVAADNGRDAIEILRKESDIDIVLMDIMMPEMDGLDTMRAIRKMPACKDLPIIAVTAKAMKGDRERCIEAGAWDYLSKPVDIDQMLAAVRSWLLR